MKLGKTGKTNPLPPCAMERIVKVLRLFPKLFQQPANYIRRKSTKRSVSRSESRFNSNSRQRNDITLKIPSVNDVSQDIKIRRANTITKTPKYVQKSTSVSENDLLTSVSPVDNMLPVVESLPGRYSKSMNHIDENRNYDSLQNLSKKNVQSNEQEFRSKSTNGNVSEIPRLVAHAIGTAVGYRLRIINGSQPDFQAQILLNSSTRQPWEDLVNDLGMAVGIPRLHYRRKFYKRLETHYGRQIQSYSQLRSELKVGNNMFYIYADEVLQDPTQPVLRQRLSITPEPSYASRRHTPTNRRSRSRSASSRLPYHQKYLLEKEVSNSSTELITDSLAVPRRKRRSSRSRSPSYDNRASGSSTPYRISPYPYYERSVHFRK